MVQWLTDVLDAIGLFGVAFLVALESVFPPIPSEAVLLLTGFNVDTGRFSLVPAVAMATVGSVVGAWILYGLGYWIRGDRLTRVLGRVGRWVGLTPDDVATGFEWFNRHGRRVVFFGRLVPGVRSVVSIPAGAGDMSLLSFTAYTAAGSLLWNVVWVAAGQALGSRWRQAEQWHSVIDWVVVGVLVVGTAWLILKARRRQRRRAYAFEVEDG